MTNWWKASTLAILMLWSKRSQGCPLERMHDWLVGPQAISIFSINLWSSQLWMQFKQLRIEAWKIFSLTLAPAFLGMELDVSCYTTQELRWVGCQSFLSVKSFAIRLALDAYNSPFCVFTGSGLTAWSFDNSCIQTWTRSTDSVCLGGEVLHHNNNY